MRRDRGSLTFQYACPCGETHDLSMSVRAFGLVRGGAARRGAVEVVVSPRIDLGAIDCQVARATLEAEARS